MDKANEKVKNILEYMLIIIMCFIGIRKGGYYKEDSLIGIYIIVLISILYYLFNYNRLKINKKVVYPLCFLSIAYFIPVIIKNSATVSGAISIATRIYSMFLVYLIVSNSKNKEKYIKAIVVFTVICAIFALDEASYRVFNTYLSKIGSGYLDEYTGRISSVLQYSNILGILALISILYLKDKVINYSKKSKKIKIVCILTLECFLTTILILTGSKMVLFIYIISTIVLNIVKIKKNVSINVLLQIVNLLLAIVATVLIENYSVFMSIAQVFICFLVSYIYLALDRRENSKNMAKYIFLALVIIVVLVFLIMEHSLLSNTKIIISIKEYFNSFDSTKLRFTYYVDALKIIFQSPLNFMFGKGGNAFRTLYETVQTESYISLEVHSFFIQIFLEAGILGLILILMPVIYLIKKSKNNIYKLIFLSVLIFMSFDVFLTYTFMLYVFGIIMACLDISFKENSKGESIAFVILCTFMFILLSLEVLAFFINPQKVDNLNVDLKTQESIIKRCEIALMLDPFDLEYMENYTSACKNYLDILDIKKELYGTDDTQKRYEIVNKIYKNTKNELKYEENNKYALEDSVYYVYSYLDELVFANYESNEEAGYEYYLEEMMDSLQILITYHSKNDYATQVYKNSLENIYDKYISVAMITQNQNIIDTLNYIQEKLK